MAKVYANPKQLALLRATQKQRIFMGGRGSGKTTVRGAVDFERVFALPRAKGAIVGLTYNQILTKILPPAIDHWSRCGMREYISIHEPGHFVIGRKPPREWPKPFQPPRRYENVISFVNGTCIEMISLDRKDLNRGGNYDWMDFDEAVLIDKDQHDKELLPMVRANPYRFSHHLHHSSIYTSSMPWTISGNWVPDMKQLAEAFPKDYFYIEATCFDNLPAVGEEYPIRLQRSLPPLVYQVEVENLRIRKLPNGYYPGFDDTRNTEATSYVYDYNEKGIYTQSEISWDAELPIDLSFDFNAGFNSCILGQMDEATNTYHIHREFYVGAGHVITDLCEKVGKFLNSVYPPGHMVHLQIYGDATGHRRDAGRKETLYEQITDKLSSFGNFVVDLKVEHTVNEYHQLRYHLINNLLSEEDPTLPRIRINKEHCKSLIISISFAPILPDFKKDKRSERNLDETEQHMATHLSDAFDYLIYEKFAREIERSGSGSTMAPIFITR